MNSNQSTKWWALGAILLAVLAVSMDGTILSVAVPTLATQLHASESQLQWFSSGYFLVLAAGILPAGRLGDRFGRKRVLLTSVGLFAVGSVACALSTTPTEFLIARFVLGLAGAGTVVMAMSALVGLFSESERPKAVGLFAAANFLSLPLGPVLGGWLLTHYWWGWVFLINAPICLIGFIAALVLIPESRAPHAPKFDPVGILLSTAGLVSLIFGLIEAGQNGWADAGALSFMGAGIVVLVLFVFWDRRLLARGGEPLLNLSLFSSRSFTFGAVLGSLAALTMIGVLFVMPQFFQGVLGTDAIGAGLRLLPLLAGLVAGALLADRLTRVLGWRSVIVLGFVIVVAGLLVGTITNAGSSELFIGTWMLVYGAGLGLTTAAASSAAISTLSQADSGAGSAIVQLIQKLAAPLGSAVLGSVVSAVYLSQLTLTGLPAAAASAVRKSVFAGAIVARESHSSELLKQVRDAFTAGLSASLLVSACIALAGIILAIVFMPGRREMAATRVMSSHPDHSEEVIAS